MKVGYARRISDINGRNARSLKSFSTAQHLVASRSPTFSPRWRADTVLCVRSRDSPRFRNRWRTGRHWSV